MEWIKVSDKLPNENDKILFSDGESVELGKYSKKDWYYRDEIDGRLGFIDFSSWSEDFGYKYFYENVLFWMYPPELPKLQ